MYVLHVINPRLRERKIVSGPLPLLASSPPLKANYGLLDGCREKNMRKEFLLYCNLHRNRMVYSVFALGENFSFFYCWINESWRLRHKRFQRSKNKFPTVPNNFHQNLLIFKLKKHFLCKKMLKIDRLSIARSYAGKK